MTRSVVGSMREIVSSPSLATQTAPSPTRQTPPADHQRGVSALSAPSTKLRPMAHDLPPDLLTEIDQRRGNLEGIEELRAAAVRASAQLRRPVTAYDVLASARDATERCKFVTTLNRLRAQG